ncbi:uncharacterized protein LOC143186705 [Calliopsis andreniformis]|uniref:uncharacterized protein LOC143186705 n=1 Tax=Calliopsis andreniformis TaxID=337506 RepID=UPI003FCD31B4
MCSSNSPCRSPPRSGASSESHPDSVRFHQQHPQPPPPPYVYYPPPPYPPLNPYSPYAHPYHPGAFYPSPYCNDVTQESKGGASWFSIVLIGLLILCVISIVFYRALPRDTRRRLHARLPNLTQPAQGYNRGDRVL